MMTANLPMSAAAHPRPRKALHVLTLTPFYPALKDDAQGCFVAEPLPWVAQLGIANTVLAVQPFYRGRAHATQSSVPARWTHFFAFPGGLGLPTSGAFLYAQILAEVRRLHRAKPVQIVHAHSALPCGHTAALLSRELGIPFVVSVHGLDAFSTNQAGGYTGKWCRRISEMVYRSARRVICISEKVREQLMEGAAPINTAVVYNGVDPQIFSPAENAGASDVILSVGNLIPIKGHELLLRAFAAIHDSYPDVSCEIIGDGPERSRLEALAGELGIAGKVRFFGRQNRSQVAQSMRRCTLFALPSRFEGLGCVYLEAMAAGKPVIACRGQGIEEVIQHGSNGWLVDPEDLQGLTSALSVLLQNVQLRRQIGGAARETIRQGFTLAHQAGRLVQLYRECLA
ncbi:MAG TPA: glycosyltransferase [Terriglobales bacterium]|nr:glycosyltransferase [Terriglobales bacterium]